MLLLIGLRLLSFALSSREYAPDFDKQNISTIRSLMLNCFGKPKNNCK